MTKKEKIAKKIAEITGGDPEKIAEEFTTLQLEELLKTVSLVPKPDPVIKTPDMDVSSVKAIHNKMRIINAKLKSTDLKDQEEGKADLEALTIKVREEANKIDIRTKFMGNV